MLRNFESALLRYCSLKLDKGLFSLSKKDGLDKWSWHLDVRISQKFCQKRCNFLWKWSQKIKLLEWCSFKLFCSTSSHHFNFVWMYVFNAFSPITIKRIGKQARTLIWIWTRKNQDLFLRQHHRRQVISWHLPVDGINWRQNVTLTTVTILAFLSKKKGLLKIFQKIKPFFSNF